MAVDVESLRASISESRPPFSLNRIGHVVLRVPDLARSIAFYTGVLGFRVSDIHGEEMMPGGQVHQVRRADWRTLLKGRGVAVMSCETAL